MFPPCFITLSKIREKIQNFEKTKSAFHQQILRQIDNLSSPWLFSQSDDELPHKKEKYVLFMWIISNYACRHCFFDHYPWAFWFFFIVVLFRVYTESNLEELSRKWHVPHSHSNTFIKRDEFWNLCCKSFIYAHLHQERKCFFSETLFSHAWILMRLTR